MKNRRSYHQNRRWLRQNEQKTQYATRLIVRPDGTAVSVIAYTRPHHSDTQGVKDWYGRRRQGLRKLGRRAAA